MTLAVGDVAQINATKKPANSTDKLTWSSSDESVATVSSKGVVQGVSAGTATITVKTTSKKTAKCTVTVKDYATKEDLQLLSQIMYTKEEIDAMLAAVTNDALNWEDGTELTIYSSPKSNYSIPGEFPVARDGDTNMVYDGSITINEASIKKYRFEEYKSYNHYLFKYVIDIRGTLPASGADGLELRLDLYDSSLTSNTATNDDSPIYISSKKWTIDGNEFSINRTFYSNFNYSLFYPLFYYE